MPIDNRDYYRHPDKSVDDKRREKEVREARQTYTRPTYPTQPPGQPTMTPQDAQQFNQAVALANAGQKLEAHKQLRALLPTYPNDANLLMWAAFTNPNLQEAEAMLRKAYSIDPNSPALAQAQNWLQAEKAKQQPVQTPPPFMQQQRAVPPQQTYYPTPPQPVYASQPVYYQPAPVRPPSTGVRVSYGVIGVGLLITVIGVFLSWVDWQAIYQGISYRASMNGLGQIGGDPVFVEAIHESSSIGVKDGLFALIGAVPIGLLTLGGFLSARNSRYAIGTLIIAILGCLMYAVDVADSGKYLGNTSGSGGSAVSVLGPGMPAGLIGCIVMVGGSIAVLAVAQRAREVRRI